MRPSPERLAEIRAWADGQFADGRPHIPKGMPSFTRDLLAELDALEKVPEPLPRTRVGLMHSLAEAQLALDRATEIAKVVGPTHAPAIEALYDGLLEVQDGVVRDVTHEEHAEALEASQELLERHDQLTAGWPEVNSNHPGFPDSSKGM